MHSKQMILQDSDREAVRILSAFLPDRIFDAHAHLYDPLFCATGASSDSLLQHNFDTYQTDMTPLLCHPKTLRANFIVHPMRSMASRTFGVLEKSDIALVQELERHPQIVGEIMVHPDETPQEIEERLVHPRIRGLKCYHLLAKREDTMGADIGQYLPESAWEVAGKHKLVITLHLVKEKSLADPDNLSYIQTMAKAYPDATLILAHAARAFASWTGVEYVGQLKHLDNVLYDFSAVCESPALFQLLKMMGSEKCMWGSDFPICRMRGKAISLADGFYWIGQKDLAQFGADKSEKSWLVATENLMATRQACLLAELKDREVENLFYHTAARLFS